MKRLRVAAVWSNRDQRRFAVLIHNWIDIDECRRRSDAHYDSEIKDLKQVLFLATLIRAGAPGA